MSRVTLLPEKPHKAALRSVIIALAWPVGAEMALQTLTQMVDMAMVGRLGPEAIAAIGLSFRPVFIPYAAVLGFGAGVAAVVSRYTGAKEHREASRAAAQAILTFALAAMVTSLIFHVFARQIVALMGAEDNVIELGRLYLRGMSPGLGFMLLGSTMTFALRGAGDTKTPLKVNTLANIANVGLNYVLIFGHLGLPALGLYGAGLATSISRTAAALALFLLMLRHQAGLRVYLKDFSGFDTPLIRKILKIGVPAVLERLNYSIAYALHLRIVAGLGTTVVAAATVASSVELIAFMPAIGFSVAAATTVGQSLGAQRPQLAKEYALQACFISSTFMGFMGLLFFVFPRPFLTIFTSDPAVIQQGVLLLRIIALSQVFTAISHTLAGALRGAGDTKSVLIVNVIASWGVRVGLALILVAAGFGAAGAWFALLADVMFQSASLAWIFRKEKWMKLAL